MKQSYYLLLGLLLGGTPLQAQMATSAKQPLSSTSQAVAGLHKPAGRQVATSPVYVKLYGLYGLLTPGSLLITDTKGLGAGVRAGAGVGFIANDFINVGLDADLLFGDNLKKETVAATGITTKTTDFKIVSVTPNITFKALAHPAYYIYNRLGIMVGKVLTYQTTEEIRYASTGASVTTRVLETDFGDNSLVLGYQAALGVQFRLSEALRGFVEVVAINQSFKPKERTDIVTNTKDGKVTSTSKSYYAYEKEGERGYTKYPDGRNVYLGPTYNVPLNSIGVGAGLVFRF
ncbi:hypothetical protein GCM10023187_02050 [Nibrella viscosa]|uniref:Outer membrane protein beta-barrel domain-containing protein n=1 Tax=Nibrella viscosa TaxID=1084524 RepID=A0ABP8JSY8_9BACT